MRADSQFQTCLYVNDNEEKRRECLVLKSGWAPQEAERRLAAMRASVRRTLDSIDREQMRELAIRQRIVDSIAHVRATEQARRDSVRSRARRRDSVFAASKPYWGSIRYHLFYSNVRDCQQKYGIEPADRRLFDSSAEAEQAGFHRTVEPAC